MLSQHMLSLLQILCSNVYNVCVSNVKLVCVIVTDPTIALFN